MRRRAAEIAGCAITAPACAAALGCGSGDEVDAGSITEELVAAAE